MESKPRPALSVETSYTIARIMARRHLRAFIDSDFITEDEAIASLTRLMKKYPDEPMVNLTRMLIRLWSAESSFWMQTPKISPGDR